MRFLVNSRFYYHLCMDLYFVDLFVIIYVEKVISVTERSDRVVFGIGYILFDWYSNLFHYCTNIIFVVTEVII